MDCRRQRRRKERKEEKAATVAATSYTAHDHNEYFEHSYNNIAARIAQCYKRRPAASVVPGSNSGMKNASQWCSAQRRITSSKKARLANYIGFRCQNPHGLQCNTGEKNIIILHFVFVCVRGGNTWNEKEMLLGPPCCYTHTTRSYNGYMYDRFAPKRAI